MYDIIAILIPIVLAVCIVLAIRIVADAGTRRRIAETQTEPEAIRTLIEAGDQLRRRSNRNWAVQLLVVGGAMIAIHYLHLDADDPMAYGLLFMAAGVGLLLSQALDGLRPAR